jgi:hypothetical protein
MRQRSFGMTSGSDTQAPRWQVWDTLVHIYRGEAVVNGTPLKVAEAALLVDEAQVGITATSDATLPFFHLLLSCFGVIS